MRYQLRPRGKPESFDQRFPGLYNARRDALTRFWREQFGALDAVEEKPGKFDAGNLLRGQRL